MRAFRSQRPARKTPGATAPSCKVKPYQQQFLDFVIERGALRFGEFTLKSGRISPYFFNAGSFNSGYALQRLGEFYAHAISDWDQPFDTLFGPAYKGIPLVSATAIALSSVHGLDVPYVFNRKEVKDHGEGGALVGAALRGRVVIVDDVVSAGLSVALSLDLIRQAGAEAVAVFVALDREERAEQGRRRASHAIEKRYGIPVRAIVSLTDLIHYLEDRPEYAKHVDALRVYRRKYGATEDSR